MDAPCSHDIHVRPARCLDNSIAACLPREKPQGHPDFQSFSLLNEPAPCKPSMPRTDIAQLPPQDRLP